jgi:hypothetical protein
MDRPIATALWFFIACAGLTATIGVVQLLVLGDRIRQAHERGQGLVLGWPTILSGLGIMVMAAGALLTLGYGLSTGYLVITLIGAGFTVWLDTRLLIRMYRSRQVRA